MNNINNTRYRKKATIIISNLIYILVNNIKLKLKSLSIWELAGLRGEILKHTYDILQVQTSDKKGIPSMFDMKNSTFSHPLYILCEEEMSLRYNKIEEDETKVEPITKHNSTLPKFNL